jgi:plastocyanin
VRPFDMNDSIHSTMKTYLSGLAIALVAGSIQFASAGDVTGKVTLKGTPKPELPIDLNPACGKINSAKPTTRHFMVGKDGGLANVFVYIKDAKKAPATAPSPTLDQVGCMYEPYILGAVTGQKIKIVNSDPEFHNVHATPDPKTGNKEFNFAQMTKGRVDEKAFDNAEVLVRFKCDVHPWMYAYIGVLDHPYFAVTDKEGNFKISGLPDGKYTIVAYHLKTHGKASLGVTKEIEVKGDAKQDFTVDAPAQ